MRAVARGGLGRSLEFGQRFRAFESVDLGGVLGGRAVWGEVGWLYTTCRGKWLYATCRGRWWLYTTRQATKWLHTEGKAPPTDHKEKVK